jgi:PAS domain S-box-containing protein
MQGKEESHNGNALIRVIKASGIILLFISLLSAAGWITGQRELLILFKEFLPMPPVNSLFFFIFGTVFLFHDHVRPESKYKTSLFLTFLLIFIYSLLKFSGHLIKIDLLFEDKLFPVYEKLGKFPLRHMSPYSGLLFILSSSAVLLLLSNHKRPGKRDLAATAGLIVSLAGFIAVLGYLYGTPFLYSGNIIPLSSRTALAFILTGTGIILLAGKDSFLLKHLTSTLPYSAVLRIFIPFIIALFLVQGVLDVVFTHLYHLNEALVLALTTFLSLLAGVPVIIKVTSTIFRNATIAEKERQLITAELRKVLNTQKLILENSPLGICMVKHDIIQWSNSQFRVIFRLKAGGITNQTFSGILPSSESAQLIEKWNYNFRNGNLSDTAVELKGNPNVWLRFIGSAIDPENDDSSAIWLIEDITERKRQRDTMRLLSHTVSSLSECVSITDTSDNIIFVNKAFENAYGYTSEEILGKNISILRARKASPDKTGKILSETIDGGWTGEIMNRRKNGTEFPVYLNTSKVTDENNEIIALVGVAVDITERKEAQRREKNYLEQLKNSNDAKDKLFNIISHDLRSPFTSIIGFFQLLSEQYDIMSEEEKKSFINELKESVENTFALIENLLTWSRAQRGGIKASPSIFRLHGATNELTQVLEKAAEKKGINIHNRINPDVSVFADRDMIKTVILNLINNAIKFTGKGGSIIISSAESDSETMVSVSDTGIGIPEERLKGMFSLDKSVSTLGTSNEKGTGLGLIICREFVEKNGGRIWVDSHPGQGSTFSFTIPLAG